MTSSEWWKEFLQDLPVDLDIIKPGFQRKTVHFTISNGQWPAIYIYGIGGKIYATREACNIANTSNTFTHRIERRSIMRDIEIEGRLYLNENKSFVRYNFECLRYLYL